MSQETKTEYKEGKTRAHFHGFLSRIDSAVLAKAFSFLDLPSVVRASRTCKQLSALVLASNSTSTPSDGTQTIWKRLLDAHFEISIWPALVSQSRLQFANLKSWKAVYRSLLSIRHRL